MKRLVFLLNLMVSITFGFLPLVSFAQIPDINIPFALSNELNVELIPNYPRPNELVFVELTLYTADLNSADISWYKNGKLDLQGKGKVSYSFKNSEAGKETQIEVRIKLSNGTSFSKKLTLNPASIDLIWESNSYVPPFYKGKALHPKQGTVKIVAMPEFIKNGKRVAPENLVYEWSNDVEAYQSQSGFGKNVLILPGSVLGQTEKINLLVTDPVNNLVAEGYLDINPSNPEINFYLNDPYYGYNFENALPKLFDLKNEEVSIIAAPYFTTIEREGLLKYNWSLNGAPISALNDSITAVFRKPEDISGQSLLNLRIENSNKILQQGENGILIKFDN